eukprot:COSAG01_NODE_351_length_18449_cov_34.646886_9_plen_169_part_00
MAEEARISSSGGVGVMAGAATRPARAAARRGARTRGRQQGGCGCALTNPDPDKGGQVCARRREVAQQISVSSSRIFIGDKCTIAFTAAQNFRPQADRSTRACHGCSGRAEKGRARNMQRAAAAAPSDRLTDKYPPAPPPGVVPPSGGLPRDVVHYHPADTPHSLSLPI